MIAPMEDPLTDHQHRTAKLLMDSGEAATREEADAILGGYRMVVHLGSSAADSATLQAAALTAVNAGARCFLGGVCVTGALDVPLRVRWPTRVTLGEALAAVGARPVWASAGQDPHVYIGESGSCVATSEFAVRATFNGWRAGIVPSGDAPLAERQEFIPSGVLAGGLAVSETFWYHRRNGVGGGQADVGRRAAGLSLWEPGTVADWRTLDDGPLLLAAPSRLWLIGLGHLGQAYLWTIGMLPYIDSSEVELVLQDFDMLTVANSSTGLLTMPPFRRRLKTRIAAEWMEARGFRTRLVERPFGPHIHVGPDDPTLALAGVDRIDARSALEQAGFRCVIDGGLGRGEAFHGIQIHGFPGSRRATDMWRRADIAKRNPTNRLLGLPAYRALVGAASARGEDPEELRCGLTRLANCVVAAAFVGASAAAVVVSEALRVASGEAHHEVVDFNIHDLRHRTAVSTARPLHAYNPGIAGLKAV
jgi:hypothetical protein